MEENQILLKIKDGKVDISFAKPITLPDFMSVMFTVQLQAMNQTLPAKTDPNYNAIRDDIYDKFNVGASTLLTMFAPDKELRPDITEESLKHMMKAEDSYMKSKMNRETRRELERKAKKNTKLSVVK